MTNDVCKKSQRSICLSVSSETQSLSRLFAFQSSSVLAPSESIKFNMSFSQNQLNNSTNKTSSDCVLWIENHTIDQNWSEIEKEFLDLCVGPQRFNLLILTCSHFLCRLPGHILYPLTSLYILMGITGTLGNLMVQLVIIRWETQLGYLREAFHCYFSKTGCYFLRLGDKL